MNKFTQITILVKRLSRRMARQKTNLLLSISIIVCTCIAASLGLFANSVQSALDDDIANFLGAPMVVRSSQSLPLEHFNIEGLENSVVTATFTAGAISQQSYQSVSLKGVSRGYPLGGELIVRNNAGRVNVKANELTIDSVWLDQRAMNELNVQLGDQIQLGSVWLVVTAELIHEPDRLTQLQHTLPRAMISIDTLAKTKINHKNNRGEHRVLIKGDESALLALEEKLSQVNISKYEVLRPGKGRHPFSRISLRAQRLLNVILVLILLMCGGAAAILADYSVRNYAMPATVLRCMGLNRRIISWALCLKLLMLALVMSLLGCMLGWLVQPVLMNVMQPHMTLQRSSITWQDVLGPIGIGLVTVVAFVMPKLQQLASMSVSSVLRGYSEKPKRFYLTVFSGIVVVFTMLWHSSDNIELTVMLVIAVMSLVVLSIFFGWALSKLTAQTHQLFVGPLKIAVRSIGRSSKRHIISLVSVAIIMMAVLMTITLRGSFLDALEIQSLDTDGNYIYNGLPAEQRDEFSNMINLGGAELKGSYPTVYSRLVSINGMDINTVLNKESDTREQIRSKIRLSWAKTMPSNNLLLEGEWPKLENHGVSVEAEVMTDLDLRIGDELGFQIGDEILVSTITSRRKYKGGGSRMMFWFMFAPDTLKPFEQHYMGGVLIKGNSQAMLSNISYRFPQIRITDLEGQMKSIRDIMTVLTRLMNSTLVLLLCGALMVIIAASYVSATNRRAQSSLMRVMGLRRSQCYAMNMVEQLIIGLVACLIGILGVQLIAGVMFDQLFALSYVWEWQSALILTALISATFVGLGWVFAMWQLRQPITLLQA